MPKWLTSGSSAPSSAAAIATMISAGGQSQRFAEKPNAGTTSQAARFATKAKVASVRRCRRSPAAFSSLQNNPAKRDPIAIPKRYAASRSPNAPGSPQLAYEITRYQRISYESAMKPPAAATTSATANPMGREIYHAIALRRRR